MVQKYLVNLRDKIGVFDFENFVDGFGHKNCHHLMKDSYVYSKVFFVYFGMVGYHFNSVEKTGSFHLGLLEYVGYHSNLRNLMFVVGDFVVVKMNDYVDLYEEV